MRLQGAAGNAAVASLLDDGRGGAGSGRATEGRGGAVQRQLATRAESDDGGAQIEGVSFAARLADVSSAYNRLSDRRVKGLDNLHASLREEPVPPPSFTTQVFVFCVMTALSVASDYVAARVAAGVATKMRGMLPVAPRPPMSPELAELGLERSPVRPAPSTPFLNDALTNTFQNVLLNELTQAVARVGASRLETAEDAIEAFYATQHYALIDTRRDVERTLIAAALTIARTRGAAAAERELAGLAAGIDSVGDLASQIQHDSSLAQWAVLQARSRTNEFREPVPGGHRWETRGTGTTDLSGLVRTTVPDPGPGIVFLRVDRSGRIVSARLPGVNTKLREGLAARPIETWRMPLIARTGNHFMGRNEAGHVFVDDWIGELHPIIHANEMGPPTAGRSYEEHKTAAGVEWATGLFDRLGKVTLREAGVELEG